MIKLLPGTARILYLDKSKWVTYVSHLTKHLDANERHSKLEIQELLLAQNNSLAHRKLVCNK